MTDMDPTEISIEPDPTPAAKPRARSIALIVGIVAVLGGAIFAGLSLADDANAPEDPVRAMFAAAEEGDVLGVLEQLEPGERDALRDPIADLVSELNRLEILDADVRDLSGVEVEIEDLELASDRVGDDVAAVTITGGRGRFELEPSELPLGDFLRDLIGDGLDEAEPESSEDSLASTGEDDFVATVRRDGRWYVSIGYTVAENARRDAGVAFDEMGEGIEANGADSPEAAVRELVEASTDLDLRRVIELLPPGELGALQEYAGLFIDEAEDAAEEARSGIEIEVPTLELDSETDGSRATVFIRDMEFRASAGDEGSVSYQDGCFSMEIAGQEPQEVCEGDDPTAALEDGVFGRLEGLGFGDLGLDGIEPPELSFADDMPDYGITTVQVDGKWYVSPTRTVLDNLVETARMFEPADLREIRRFVEELFGAFEESMSSGFGFDEGLDGIDSACFDEAETPEEIEACFETSMPTTTTFVMPTTSVP